jgi:amino acid transporter
VALLFIVTASYYQTIHAYPSGGGAYIVARENLGVNAGLVAAAALMIDYVLTVAVSIAAGVAAVTSAFPALYVHRVGLCLACILGMTLINLRGVKESGKIFAVPTYRFIASFFSDRCRID